jgi:hypothetical protein
MEKETEADNSSPLISDEPSVIRDADFDAILIEEAKSGNRNSAVQLLTEVSTTEPRAGLTPTILAYLSECIRKWAASDFAAAAAASAFNVQRPKHRPNDDHAIKMKHVTALKVYYLMRGRRKGREEAIRIAAEHQCTSESTIKRLLEQCRGGLSVEEGEALLSIHRRVRRRCMNPTRKAYRRPSQGSR